MPRASWDPSLLKEMLRTDSSMLQRARSVWSGRLHSLTDRQTDNDSADKDTRGGEAHDVHNQPHRTVVTASDSNRLFGVKR